MKQIRISLGIMLLTLAALLSAGEQAFATPILSEWQDGTGSRPFTGWNETAYDRPEHNGSTTLNSGSSTLSMGTSGAGETVGGEGALEVTASAGGELSLFYTEAFGTVNLNDYAGVSFDFYAEDSNQVLDFGFYFQSSEDQSVWYYSFGTPAAATWQTFGASLSYSEYSWSGLAVSGATYDEINVDIGTAFDTALAGADQLGFYIDQNTGDSTIYGVDEFGLTVPEPETYMALGMAMLGVAFVFRKRITESLDEARAAMQH